MTARFSFCSTELTGIKSISAKKKADSGNNGSDSDRSYFYNITPKAEDLFIVTVTKYGPLENKGRK